MQELNPSLFPRTRMRSTPCIGSIASYCELGFKNRGWCFWVCKTALKKKEYARSSGSHVTTSSIPNGGNRLSLSQCDPSSGYTLYSIGEGLISLSWNTVHSYGDIMRALCFSSTNGDTVASRIIIYGQCKRMNQSTSKGTFVWQHTNVSFWWGNNTQELSALLSDHELQLLILSTMTVSQWGWRRSTHQHHLQWLFYQCLPHLKSLL